MAQSLYKAVVNPNYQAAPSSKMRAGLNMDSGQKGQIFKPKSRIQKKTLPKNTEQRRNTMAINSFLKIGDMPGECTKKGYEDCIELFAHDYTIERKIGGSMSDGMQASGRPDFQPFEIIKRMDKTTPLFIKACLNSTTIDEVQLFLVKTAAGGGGEDFTYVEYTLKNVTVVSVSPVDSDSIDDEVIKEHISFVFEEFLLTYTADNHGAAAGSVDVAYNLKTGAVS